MDPDLTVRVRPVPACAAPATARRGDRATGRRRPAGLAALLGLLLVTGCAADPAPPPAGAPAAAGTASAAVRGLDVVFLTMMVAHTERTLEIVRLVRDRLTDGELRTLVAAIETTESDELTIMRGWLRAADPAATAGRHDHAGHADAADLDRLRSATGADVDRVLREVLSAHQQAAADLARAHRATAVAPEVADLARRVEQSRTAQVELMARRPAAGG
ncbi:Uncharacterized conserved protein, DUF305 family [Micromonospora echinaurantiaca]|uniref:Uncharacterized conserved protein, DUF305 family n=1 Tax=Micromonospora echinaurantiaca TaxID=47857 RepID=A0A1C5J8D3_9ACTN|nr:Uncharacterized conserved protein, DUF305 family [Micromonospora echinaurantiaca]